jgi:hypothetical protein
MAIKSVTFTNEFGDFTGSVMSWSYQWGRQSYLDNWNGNGLTITLRNNNNQAAAFLINSTVTCSILPGTFWIAQITYQDAPGLNGTAGSGAGSTATIICDDWLARAGRIQVTNKALTQTSTIAQIFEFSSELAANDLELDTTYTTGQSRASAATYTGTIANRINLNMNTERGQIRYTGKKAAFYPRNSISINPAAVFIASKDEGGVTVLYQDFERRTLGQSFSTVVTVQPEALAPQTATNVIKSGIYGVWSSTTSTVDATTTQAFDLATWLSNIQGEPSTLTFSASLSDTGNSVAAFDNWLSWVNFWGMGLHFYTPGNAFITETEVVLEGISYSGTPDRTETVAYFSPKEFYNIFLLDSSTQGRLDTNVLGF